MVSDLQKLKILIALFQCIFWTLKASMSSNDSNKVRMLNVAENHMKFAREVLDCEEEKETSNASRSR